jgi:hypothetical protein
LLPGAPREATPSIGPIGDDFPNELEMLSLCDKELKDTISTSWIGPQEMLWDVQAGKQDTKAFWEAMFIGMPAATQQSHIQRLSPEHKEALLYIPLQADYRNEKQSLTHTWLLIISLATSLSMLCDHFLVEFL